MIKRYNGEEEFSEILKTLSTVPSNTEISEKTGVSKGSISRIMNGKITPTKKFVEKFKEGFKIETKHDELESEKPQNDDCLDNLSSKEYINHLLKEIDFLRELLLKK